ncbi:50S ribosomal protein L7ae [Candidatus Woesearchaeota archaeon]|nr:50S ribosomal protein L7ae [Candidatus Woesearchaeota archaeon]
MALKFNYQVTKEISEKALEAVEIARTSGKIKKGTNEVTKAVERNRAKLVVLAQDVQPEEVVMHLPILCDERKIPCIPVNAKTELGAAAGLQLGCSSVAIIEEGESKKLINEIAKEISVPESK